MIKQRYFIEFNEYEANGYEWFPVYYGENKNDPDKILVAKFLDEDDALDFIRMATNRVDEDEEDDVEVEPKRQWDFFRDQNSLDELTGGDVWPASLGEEDE